MINNSQIPQMIQLKLIKVIQISEKNPQNFGSGWFWFYPNQILIIKKLFRVESWK